MKKRDWILAGCVIVVALVWTGFFWWNARKAGNVVVVVQDGVRTCVFSLEEEQTVKLEDGRGGGNTLVIQGGTARVTWADCPDKLCVEQRAISRRGESIVCLPHRLVISIEGDGGEEKAVDNLDAVARFVCPSVFDEKREKASRT